MLNTAYREGSKMDIQSHINKVANTILFNMDSITLSGVEREYSKQALINSDEHSRLGTSRYSKHAQKG